MKKKYIPIGIDNFKKIIEENFYFVDKSLLIEELLEDGSKVIVLPRPRRFGKTLNMSMLKYFFEIRDCNENRKLFSGLKIEDSKYINHQGKYPVIYLSFKDIKQRNWKDCLYKMKLLISDIYLEHDYLRESLKEIEKDNFDNISRGLVNEEKLEDSILDLCRYMEKYFNQKVIILLDEYDTPLIEAYLNGYYDEAFSFFRNLMSAAFKSNEYLKFGVITGIIQISNESIFSSVNNVNILTSLDEPFNHFGFSEDEVIEMLKYYELSDKLEEVKKWYNGYIFGNKKVYNPWTINNYVKNKKIKNYWINTSSNGLIVNLMKDCDELLFRDLKELFSNGSIVKSIDNRITHLGENSVSDIWSLMFFTGYLTYEESVKYEYTKELRYRLVIPNGEIRSFFRTSLLDYGSSVDSVDFVQMMVSLKSNSIEEFIRKFQKIFSSIVTYNEGNSEKSYYNFVLAMTSFLYDKYEISSNRESVSGRYDIAMTPRVKSNHGIIFHFKVAKSEEELKEQSLETLKGIDEKEYTVNMKSQGIEKIIKIRIAFSGKELEISYTDK